MKKIIIGLVILLVVIGVGWYFLGGTPITLTEDEERELVSIYLQENLSIISPEPEVLGGTFYPTRIEFTGDNAGVIDYEDGHIALTALFTYDISLGRVSILEFNLLPTR